MSDESLRHCNYVVHFIHHIAIKVLMSNENRKWSHEIISFFFNHTAYVCISPEIVETQRKHQHLIANSYSFYLWLKPVLNLDPLHYIIQTKRHLKFFFEDIIIPFGSYLCSDCHNKNTIDRVAQTTNVYCSQFRRQGSSRSRCCADAASWWGLCFLIYRESPSHCVLTVKGPRKLSGVLCKSPRAIPESFTLRT